MCDSEDVLTRLDTLLTSCDSGPNSVNSSTSSNSSTPSSILKTPDKESKKKSLRFREEKELQEVIGYGGEDNLDCSSSSEEDEESSHKVGETSLTSKSKEEQQPEELTVEEKNVLNLTRQNTTFNTHAQNLNTETSNGPPPLLRLGVDKKVTPIITVSVIFTRGFITPSQSTLLSSRWFFCSIFANGKKTVHSCSICPIFHHFWWWSNSW